MTVLREAAWILGGAALMLFALYGTQALGRWRRERVTAKRMAKFDRVNR